MIATVKRHASRVALQKVKLIFTIQVTQLIIADSSKVESGCILTVSFEKGGKISTSNEIVFDREQDDVNPMTTHNNLDYITIPTEERLELVITLYKNGDKRAFQAKSGRLILRQLKRNSNLGMDGFKSVGTHDLSLSELAEQLGSEKVLTKETTLQLTELPGSSLHVLITVRALRNIAPRRSLRSSVTGMSLRGFSAGHADLEDDDAASNDSDGSAFSTLGATFFYEDLDEYTGGRESMISTLGGARRSFSVQDRSPPPRFLSGRRDPHADEATSLDAMLRDSESVTRPKGAQRRRSSGMHVMEVALNESSSERVLPKRAASTKSAGASTVPQGDAGAADDTQLSEAGREPEGEEGEEGEGGNADGEESEEIGGQGLHTPGNHRHQSREAIRSSLQTPTAANTGGELVEDGDGWAPVLGASADRSSMYSKRSGSQPPSLAGSPYVPSDRKGRARQSFGRVSSASQASSPAHANASDRITPGRSRVSTSTGNEETFALYDKELQARAERIAQLESRLAEAEERYRADVGAMSDALRTAETELQLLRPQHIHSSATQVPAPASVASVPSAVQERGAAATEQAAHMPPAVGVEEGSSEGAVLMRPAADDIAEEDPQAQREDDSEVTPTPSDAAEPAGAVAGRSSEREDAAEDPVPVVCATEEQETVLASTGSMINATASQLESTAGPRLTNETAISALLNEYGRTTTEVKLLAQELIYYKQLAADAQRAKAEETLASREAATVAVQACMRRADCEQELADAMYLVHELHGRIAALHIEFDGEVRRNYALKARLQLYAQKLSALEVDYSLSMCQLDENGLVDDLVDENA